jgi:hypothetical protein
VIGCHRPGELRAFARGNTQPISLPLDLTVPTAGGNRAVSQRHYRPCDSPQWHGNGSADITPSRRRINRGDLAKDKGASARREVLVWGSIGGPATSGWDGGSCRRERTPRRSPGPWQEGGHDFIGQGAGTEAWSRGALRVLHHCEQVTRVFSQTCRFFGTSRTILYRWRSPVPSDGSRRYREPKASAVSSTGDKRGGSMSSRKLDR